MRGSPDCGRTNRHAAGVGGLLSPGGGSDRDLTERYEGFSSSKSNAGEHAERSKQPRFIKRGEKPVELQPRGECLVMYLLEELTAPALSRLLNAGVSTAVVPFGSIEHHGGHLPLGADAVFADAVGREVARELDAVLAPTVRLGDAEQHARLPGTITLRA